MKRCLKAAYYFRCQININEFNTKTIIKIKSKEHNFIIIKMILIFRHVYKLETKLFFLWFHELKFHK